MNKRCEREIDTLTKLYKYCECLGQNCRKCESRLQLIEDLQFLQTIEVVDKVEMYYEDDYMYWLTQNKYFLHKKVAHADLQHASIIIYYYEIDYANCNILQQHQQRQQPTTFFVINFLDLMERIPTLAKFLEYIYTEKGIDLNQYFPIENKQQNLLRIATRKRRLMKILFKYCCLW